MTAIHPDITAAIGHTPIVRLNRIGPDHVEIFAKLESFNPAGSVKDRLAMGVIEAAERDGSLQPGQTVVEATSGNTGIGLAMVCAQRGYPFVAVMAENFSVERRKLMRFLGAKVVLTPASERGSGMLAKAVELARTHGWFLPRQFENPANADVHTRTTAVEILKAFEGRRLDYFVLGTGTGGTLNGVSRVLRSERPDTRIVVAEPDNSPVLASGQSQSLDVCGAPIVPHPAFRPHLMQGLSPDFIPELTKQAFDRDHVDTVMPVSGAAALSLARDLASKEGILSGISGGAALAATLEIARDADRGANILCILPDSAERYMSTPLFADIESEMDAAELDISRSTPGYRFDVPTAPVPAAASVAADPEAVAMVEAMIVDEQQEVVMFALEWCEFCWAVRQMLKHFGIPFRSIDLDSTAFQKGELGGRIRNALAERTGIRTIPQLFVGGSFIGGSTEFFEAWDNGTLQPALQSASVPFDPSSGTKASSFLPAWLHPR